MKLLGGLSSVTSCYYVSAGEHVPPLSGERSPPEAGEVVDEAQTSNNESCVSGRSNVMFV